jgi:galactokinase
VGTDYNQRVAECAEAARTLLDACGRPDDEAVLRNIEPGEYAEYRHRLTGPPARRAAHFFSEMERVEQGVAAWHLGDLATFGRLMTESGASSIHQYECGSPPLIALYDHLVNTEGVLGARFSGAGFRGCCVALVESNAAEFVAERVKALYAASHPEPAAQAPILICDSDDGVEIIGPDDPRLED